MASVLQNAGKQGFFVISVRNSGEIDEKFDYFMQNKANFQKSQMNINPYNTTNYKNISDWTLGENKPNSNPNKANFPEGKIDAKCVFTKDYEENCG